MSSEATAQHKKNYDGKPYWQLVMIGEGRTTSKESIGPNYMRHSGMFVSKDDASQQITEPDSVRMGDEGFDRLRRSRRIPSAMREQLKIKRVV